MKFEFWEDWVPPLKNIFYLFFLLFVAAIVYTVVSSIIGYHLVIDWELVGQRLPVPVTIKELQFGNFTIPFQTNNYVITQWYQGSDLEVNQFAVYFFFIITVMALILGLTSATFLGKIPFYGLVVLFIAVLVFFKLDGLLLFGLDDNTTLILVIVSYLGLGYYFHTLHPDFDFMWRLKMFTFLTLVWGLLIYFFAETDRPFMWMASNGFLIPFLIGVVFIFSVSHEIVHFIVVALTKSSVESRNNLAHFTVFSLIYLANVLLLYLHDTHVIDWNFYYINPYLLLAISSILGLWGLQSRVNLFDLDSKMYPLVVFIYITAGICAFGTTLYFVGNSNDPILQVVKDAIIYSHLGFGAIFFIYVISNFMGMLRGNMKVYQVIYKPRNMPHFIFRFAGLIVVTALFLKEDIKTSVYHTLSGMFNSQGDYYKTVGDQLNTETYYENGGLYGYMNHKSNYSMAKINEAKNDQPEAITFYKNATRVRPSEMAYINLANLYLGIGDFFNSMFTLNDGLKEFPAGKAILNNKGLLFSRTSMTDSALIYFDASARAGESRKASVVNYLAILTSKNYGFDPDSIINHYGGRGISAVKANLFLLRNLENRREVQPKEKFEDSVLNIYSASLLTNYLLNQYKYYDTVFTAARLAVIDRPVNSNYQESAVYALAISEYERGFIDNAIDLLRKLSVNSRRPEVYNYTIGLMLMDMGYYKIAADYLDLALASGSIKAGVASLISNIETGNFNADSVRARSVQLFREDSLKVEPWIQLMESEYTEIFKKSDGEKYLYLHFRSGFIKEAEISALMSSISDPQIRMKVLVELFNWTFRTGRYDLAGKYGMEIENNISKYPELKDEALSALQAYYAYTEDIESLKKLMSESDWISFDRRWYYEALIAMNSGDMEVAGMNFNAISHMNSFNEEAILKASEFFENDPDELKSYNILVNALLQNPYSVKLLKAYIKEARRQGLVSYAERAVQDLSQLIDNEELKEFLNSLPQLKEVDN